MFAYAHAAAPTWRECVSACAERLGRPGRRLGLRLFHRCVGRFRRRPSCRNCRSTPAFEDWVGSVGVGVLATGAEYQEEPAMAAMVADISDF